MTTRKAKTIKQRAAGIIPTAPPLASLATASRIESRQGEKPLTLRAFVGHPRVKFERVRGQVIC